MTLPVLARKVKKIASQQLLNLKILLNGRGFSKFKKHYKLKAEIGQGGFGIVYSAVRMSDEMPVAVKFIERRHVREWGKLNDERVPMEICMLARCTRVPGVIKLIDWYSMPEGFLIVMERPTPCIDLFDFIRRERRLTEDLARFIFRQIVQTALACAERRVLHRDIKDENVVIDLVTGSIRLIDFGAATLLKKTRYHDFQGTRLYCPPEWFLHSVYLGKEAAVWSLGVLLYNMVNGQLPFQNEKHICTSHLLGPLPFFVELSKECHDLITKCLHFNPFNRLQIEEILKHPWLQSADREWIVLNEEISSERKKESGGQSKENDIVCGNGTTKAAACERHPTSRKDTGVASSSGSYNQENRDNDVLEDKPDTVIVEKKNKVHVRRNAKTSLQTPGNNKFKDFVANVAVTKPVKGAPQKAKSGSVRPTLKLCGGAHNATSFDSGTSSAIHGSHDSLQSPLGSPFQKNVCHQFPDVTAINARV